MGGRKEGGQAQTIEPPTAPVNGLAGADLKDPLLRLAQAVIGPFVSHKPACDGQPCSCGLAAAIEELERRETFVKRYGVVE